MLAKFLSSDKKWNDWKQQRGLLGVNFQSEQAVELSHEIFGEECKQATLIGYSEQIAFLYCSKKYKGKRLTKKSIKLLLQQGDGGLGKALANIQYLVIIFHSTQAEILAGIDIANKQHPKITTALIDTAGYVDPDGVMVYKNRTIEEQFKKILDFTQGGKRQLTLRAIKKFFEKEALTEDFYEVYKSQLFDKIKKDLHQRYGKSNEDAVNNFRVSPSGQALNVGIY